MNEPAQQPKLSPLDAVHRAAGARMTQFAGWLMPLHYGSDLAEHRAVRTAAGMFDLSHMGQIAITGPQAPEFLDYALCSLISNLAVGRARYTMILTEDGGVIDDVVVYHTTAGDYLMVANASNAAVVLGDLRQRASRFDVAVDPVPGAGLLAVQGPQAPAIVTRLVPTSTDVAAIRPFGCAYATLAGQEVLLARTGYTGEDGFEIFAPATALPALWDAVRSDGVGEGVVPCGLAARDTLRLEAAMPLYGHELSRQTTPFDAGWGRVVGLDKPEDWVGRTALEAASHLPSPRVLVGLAGQGRRAARQGAPVMVPDGRQVGEVTSGALSPTLGHPIALAYIDPALTDPTPGSPLECDVRGSALAMTIVPTPFYRRPRP